MTHYYAKPLPGEEGSYEYHIRSCLEIANSFFELNAGSIKSFCVDNDVPYDAMRRICFVALFLHDVGKLGAFFQNRMEHLVSKVNGRELVYFRHELISALILWGCRECDGCRCFDDVFPYEVFAVLGHHKGLDKSWKNFARETRKKQADKISREALYFALAVESPYKDVIKRCLDKVHFDESLFAYREDTNENWVEYFFRRLDKHFKRTSLDRLKDKDRLTRICTFVRGVLCYCDWQASSSGSERLSFSHGYDSEIMESKINAAMLAENGKPFIKRNFQCRCCRKKGNVLAIAPTGSGKTEAALLWATCVASNKIILLMPTKVTSNSLYERMIKYFAEADCGITHSGAAMYLSMSKGDSYGASDEEHGDVFKLLNKYRTFMAPVTVATVDQLLSANFRVGHWYLKEIATLGASVIFDEIHSYDPYMLGLITKSIERIMRMQGRVMVMSATMPKALREHFQTLLGVAEPITADELMTRSNCTWEYTDNSIEWYMAEIKDALAEGRKVAVVVNSIGRAQELYRMWEKELADTEFADKIMCYHSAFIMLDRIAKEEKLIGTGKRDEYGRPKEISLIIATQTIEVSLDISFDYMYSELAPLDSLIQRAGRCNRKGNIEGARFIVFPISDVAQKYVYKDAVAIIGKTDEILRKRQGKLSENEIGAMLEDAYQNYSFTDHKDYKTARDNIGVIWDERAPIFDTVDYNEECVTRLISYVKVPIIPQKFYGEVTELCRSGEKKDKLKVALYEVPVGMKTLKLFNNKKCVMPPDLAYLDIYEIPYDEKIGVPSNLDDPLLY